MILRWLLILAGLTGLGALIWQTLPEAPVAVDAGSQRIEFALPDLAGKGQTLPQGEVVLLNFWATWCPPCRKEIPSMVQLHERLGTSGLKIVAVSVDSRRDDLTTFVKEYQMPFQVLHDADSAISHRYGVFRYPESFLIDRDGVILEHMVGAVDWMSPPVLAMIEAALAKPVAKSAATSAAGG